MSSGIGKRLQELRAQRGISAKFVAKQAGIPRSTYQSWELGVEIRGEPYARLAAVFGVSISHVRRLVDVVVNVSVNVTVDDLTMDTQTLSYKKLDVYQSSIQFLGIALRLIATLPKGQAKLADQFRRAALSIPLNIAEAAGKVAPAEAAHHFAIARGSAMECGAILDVLKLMGVGQKEVLVEGDGLLVRMVSNLTRMCR